MPPRNPLSIDNPTIAQNGDKISNVSQRKITRIISPGGVEQNFVVEERSSVPNGHGVYEDTVRNTVVMDAFGNPLPKPGEPFFQSHSGLYIRSLEQLAHCTSRFHPHHRTRNILIGQDGRLTPDGAVCSHCDSMGRTIWIFFAIIGFGIVFGVLKTTWGF